MGHPTSAGCRRRSPRSPFRPASPSGPTARSTSASSRASCPARRVSRLENPSEREKRPCGKEPGRCAVALDGFTSIIDLAFGPDGHLYVAQIDDASFLALEQMQGVGGSVKRCNVATGACTRVASGLQMLTSIAFRQNGSLWGTTWALVPGLGDAVQILP